jgi:ketosteroid isomerase-like protein
MTSARRRASRTSLALLAAVSIAAVGCGGSDAKSDDEQIRDTVSGYAAAFADGDGKEVCDRLTERAQKEVIAQGKALGGDFTTCEETIKQLTSVISSADKKALREIEVTKLTVKGDTATLQAGAGNGATTRMRKVDGEWLVDGTGSAQD